MVLKRSFGQTYRSFQASTICAYVLARSSLSAWVPMIGRSCGR